MSYEIIYDKQFVKVEDKFIPMVLIGSSNLFEYSGARVRNWDNLTVKSDKILFTEEEMLEYCDNLRQGIIDRNNERERNEWFDEYDDKAFGYWSSIAIGGRSTANTTFGMFKGIFKTGVKKALTIEQLAEENVMVVVKNGYKSKDVEVEDFYRVVSTNEQLIEAIATCKKQFEGTKVSTTIGFSGMYKESPKWIRRKYFPKVVKEKKIVEVDEYYTIKIDNDYLVNRTRRGYRYSTYPWIKIADKKKAERKVKTLNKKYSQVHVLETVKQKITLEV